MGDDDIKKIIDDTFNECLMRNLDSAIIFKYIDSLEKENKQLKEQWNELNRYVYELHNHQFNMYPVLTKMSELRKE